MQRVVGKAASPYAVRLSWQGVELCTPTGAYATLLCVPAAGGWVGGAHTEGGVEEIESATLSVDGEVVELGDGAVHPAASRAPRYSRST